MGDAGDVEHGIVVGKGIKAGMVAEGAFPPQRLRGVDVTFNYNVRMGRHLDIDGDPFG